MDFTKIYQKGVSEFETGLKTGLDDESLASIFKKYFVEIFTHIKHSPNDQERRRVYKAVQEYHESIANVTKKLRPELSHSFELASLYWRLLADG